MRFSSPAEILPTPRNDAIFWGIAEYRLDRSRI
jgi:hypothetical protein